MLSEHYANVNITDMYYRLNVIGRSRYPSNTNLVGWRHELYGFFYVFVSCILI